MVDEEGGDWPVKAWCPTIKSSRFAHPSTFSIRIRITPAEWVDRIDTISVVIGRLGSYACITLQDAFQSTL